MLGKIPGPPVICSQQKTGNSTSSSCSFLQETNKMGKNPDLETEEGVCWEKSTEAHGFQAHKQDTAQTGTRK